MTEFLDIEGGRIAYDVTGSGPLVVLSHGIGDRRQVYRFLAPVADAVRQHHERAGAGHVVRDPPALDVQELGHANLHSES